MKARIGIRGQFLFLLMASLLAVTTSTAYLAAQSQRDQLLRERERRGTAVLRSWASLSRERLLSDETVNLPMWDFIDELRRGDSSVLDVYLLDSAGNVLVHDDPDLVGTTGAPPDSMIRWLWGPIDHDPVRIAGGTILRFSRAIDVGGRRLGLARIEFSSAGIEEGIRESMRRIVLTAASIALVVGLLASLMLVPLTRSIHLLVEGVRRFGESFDPEDPASVDQHIEFRAFNEMGDLRDSFNEMTATLKATMLERKSLKEETGILRHQATTDALTGLFNKRQFEEDFPSLVELSAARKRSLCLLMLDMDRFKLLNDTLGHAEGDRALKDLAQSIRERTRTSERAYRVGGDEFIVISVGTTMDEAVAISERIADHYEKCKASGNPTSISFGIVAYDGHSRPEEFLHSADEEMYRVKRAKKALR